MSAEPRTRGLGPPRCGSPSGGSIGGGSADGQVGDDITHEARLRLAFESIDIDGSHSLGKRELYDALKRVGVDGSSQQMLQLYKDAHSDQTKPQDPLSWAEFRSLGFKLPQLALIGMGRPAEKLVADQIREASRPTSANRSEASFLERQRAAQAQQAAKRAQYEKAMAKPPVSRPPGQIPSLRPPPGRPDGAAAGWRAA